jgi:hypothetical protein
VIFVVVHRADHFAGGERAPAHHPGCVEEMRVHVQIAEADVLTRRIDHEIERLVAWVAQHQAVAHGDDIVLIRLATIGVRAA